MVLSKPLLGLLARQRVAVRVEHALLGGDHRTRSVAVDRATFDRFKSVSRPFIERILENFRAVEGAG